MPLQKLYPSGVFAADLSKAGSKIPAPYRSLSDEVVILHQLPPNRKRPFRQSYSVSRTAEGASEDVESALQPSGAAQKLQLR